LNRRLQTGQPISSMRDGIRGLKGLSMRRHMKHGNSYQEDKQPLPGTRLSSA
jgi:hypothetical protein